MSEDSAVAPSVAPEVPIPATIPDASKPDEHVVSPSKRRSKSKVTSPITKAGKERKPHVMTEARKQAFEKCVAARKAQLEQRKVTVTST